MLKRTIMVSAVAMLCAMPAMANDGATVGNPAGVQIAQVQATGTDAKTLIGRNVQNAQNETIGEIESVHLDSAGKVDVVVIGVGGFLGMGERLVAVAWKDLQISQNGEKVTVNMSKDQLKGQPEYRYSDPKYRGTVYSDGTPRPGIGTGDRMRLETKSGEQAANPRVSTGNFNSAGQVAASALVGATVKNSQNETIGTVDDIYVDADGSAKTAIISVGGFLGVGSRHVSMPWSAIKVQRDATNRDDVLVLINATKDSLKAMPEYMYDRR